ncbi:MAG: hypothetical protein IPI01_02890 [Ignavibacteriae bacterium]|nr:hypothetical protein [Ignavibacteriota bacterium]
MKRLLFLMLSATTLLAMPAKRTPTVVSQPDGSTLSVVAFGDERYHFNETLDGYVVVKGADRFWYFAALNAEGDSNRHPCVSVGGARPHRTRRCRALRNISGKPGRSSMNSSLRGP